MLLHTAQETVTSACVVFACNASFLVFECNAYARVPLHWPAGIWCETGESAAYTAFTNNGTAKLGMIALWLKSSIVAVTDVPSSIWLRFR